MARRLKRANASAVYRALRKKFGARGLHAKKNPVSHTVYSILLSGATPEKAERAFAALRSAYVDWNEIRVTSLRELAALIESKGCAPKRAESIKAFLQKLYIDGHTVSAQPIQKMSTKRAKEYVENTTGLPPEQVAVILLEAFDIPLVQIDKPIKYVLVRLGLAKTGSTPRQVQRVFLRLASKGKASTAYRVLHILSTDYCSKEEQSCPSCPVKKHCPSGQERLRKIREARSRPAAKKLTRRKKPARRKKPVKKKSKKRLIRAKRKK